MPKSKHGKGKHYRQIKKANIQRAPEAATFAPPPGTAPLAAAPVPAAPAVAAAPKAARAPANPAAVKVMQTPYVTGELSRIGIYVGVILGIFIVLYFVLR